MQNFLAIFTGTPQSVEANGWNALPEAERGQRAQAGIQAWHAWMDAHQAQVVVAGSPIGKTLKVSKSGVGPTNNAICGYIVVAAESHEAAARLFENHPHFALLPGDAVEVMECKPVPQAG